MAFLLGVSWVICGALMAFNPPPEGNNRASVIPIVGWVVIAAGIYFAVKSVRLQPDTDMGRPAGYVSGATPSPSKLLLACVIGAIMGVGTVWWGISSGLLSVIGLGGAMLSMTLLALPQLVTLLGADLPADSDDEVQHGITGPHVYDKIDWNADVLDEGLDDEQAAVPAAFFYGWLLSRGLLSGGYAQPGSDMFTQYQARRVTALELYWESDGCLDERDLTDEGNAFARAYYRADGESPSYYADLTETLADGLPSEYHVPYTWENQERMDKIIDQRYARWRTEN